MCMSYSVLTGAADTVSDEKMASAGETSDTDASEMEDDSGNGVMQVSFFYGCHMVVF